MKVKKICLLIFACIILFNTFAIISFAHSGRTDSNGGHTNYNTGDYHYHCGGHPAHEHPNGVCPYDKSDKTVKSNDNSFKWDYAISFVKGKTTMDSEIVAILLILFVTVIFVLIFSACQRGEKAREEKNPKTEKRFIEANNEKTAQTKTNAINIQPQKSEIKPNTEIDVKTNRDSLIMKIIIWGSCILINGLFHALFKNAGYTPGGLVVALITGASVAITYWMHQTINKHCKKQ